MCIKNGCKGKVYAANLCERHYKQAFNGNRTDILLRFGLRSDEA